jgi:peptidoglycan/xylan/chitin deacetylase (PgdA/CDA1 family)
LLFRTLPDIANEIERTNALIKSAGYKGEITMRPPYGKKLFILPWYLNQNKIKTIMCDVEPDTYFQGKSDEMVKYVLENTKPGSIIVIHPFCEGLCQSDRDALPQIIEGLKAKGFRFVTVTELLEYRKN